MKFLDLAGLSRAFGDDPGPEYIAALDAGEVVVIDAPHRVSMLRRLREGAGVHVLTGPEGAAFWLPVSVEIHVDVVPDGFSFSDRCEPNLEWALRAVGLSDIAARGAVKHYVDGKEPTAKAVLYPRWQAAKALLAEYNTPTTEYGSIIVEASHIEAVVDRAEQLAILDKVANVAADFEWNIDPAVGPMFEPEGLSIATADRTWYFPFWAKDLVPEFGYEEAVRAAVQRLVMRTPTVWHNAKADIGTQWQGDPLDAFGSDMHDTLVMAFCAGEHDLALKPLTRQLLGRDPLDFPGAMRELSVETGRRYGGSDSRNAYDLFHVLWKKLDERKQLAVYNEIERPIIPLLVSMERYGLPVDPYATITMRDSLLLEEERLRDIFLETDSLDISKDKDIRDLVKKRVGYDPGSVKQEALAKIPGEWMDLVMRYRKVRHRRRGFADKQIAKWESAGRPEDFRLYTSLNQAGNIDQHDQRGFKKAPRSGRLSSSSPDKLPPGATGAPGGNLMNQPNEGADGGFMEGVPGSKGIFVAPPGNLLWARDYKQLEIRIRAARSRDANLMEAVQSKDGPHVDFQTRIKEMTGKTIAKVAAKQGNFNAAYGGHVDMLRTILQKQRVFMDDADLALIVDANKAAYSGAYLYDEAVIARAKLTGYSETAFGRRRYDEDIFNGDRRAAMHAERALLNHVTQGTAADMLKIAMRLTVPVLKHYGAHMALQIHDELLGWAPEDTIEEFCYNLDLAVAPVQLPGVTFEMDGGFGRTWKEAKP